ncbi:kinase-like protein [Lentinus tigrinus ALCF2SS1-7]|uniref:kinase-like protein n=1 Tax=Lentinus tigrinus ALCF2SS1-7 TaxID=1328758 RepID=UPI001165F0FA|nr:kinase-like protein [Lentinus tigrinus ALCF2SS1-7]
MTTLVGSPTFSAPSFVPGSKEVQGLTKAPVAEPEIATLSSDSDDVSHPVQLTGAFKDVDAACDSQSLVKREHITSRLRVVRLLSSGSYGQVFLVQDTKTRKVYALKVISKAALEIKSYALIFEEQDILRRVAGSPELLKLLASFEDKSNFYLLMEYYPGGDLFDKIVEKGRIPEMDARPMAARIMLALEKLHKKRIIHRDIKPENIFFDHEGRAVVGDYGLCRQFGRTPDEQPWRQQEQWAHGEAEDETAHGLAADCARTVVGTAKYLAPEAWRGEAYSYGVDVWSFGITVYFMLLGKLPFDLEDAHGEEATAQAVLTRELVVDEGVLSSDAEDFLHTVLVKDDLKRPTWEQLKEHPWFDGLYVFVFISPYSRFDALFSGTGMRLAFIRRRMIRLSTTSCRFVH